MLRVTLLSRIFFDLTHGSCVSDLDLANGGSLDLISSFYTSISVIGLDLRSLVKAARWCKACTPTTPQPHVGLSSEGPQSHSC